jgi:hypothetical protein
MAAQREKKKVFHITTSVKDWRIVYGPILLKFDLTMRARYWMVSIVGFPLQLLGCSYPLVRSFCCYCWNPLFRVTYLCLIKNECILDVLVASIYFSREDVVKSLSLIVEDLIGLGLMIFSFGLKGFWRKNLGILLVGCLIIFHCFVGEYIVGANLTI